MSHGVLGDTPDYKAITSQRIESCEDCKQHPSVTFVSTTPGAIRRDPRTKSAIHRLSAHIAALEEAEAQIRQTKLVAEEELALLRVRVAPISTCPNEIIAKILLVTYSSALEEAKDPTEILFSISQVSQLWRAMALNLTQLWARMHVEWNAKQRALWLERSGTRPLDVYLTIDDHRPERWVPIQSGDVFGDQDLFLHSSRWRSLSLRSCGRRIAEEFLGRLMRSIDLKSLESLTLLSFTYGPYNMITNFGERPESASALRHLILRDVEVKALHLAVDNVVTLRLSGIPEENDPRFWVRIFGSSDRLECLILSRLRYRRSEATGGGPAIPARTHLRSLVLGNGNGRRFFRYMIRELKAPALLSLDLYLPNCSERYACEITPMVMAFFRSSPLIRDLTIRMNYSIAIKFSTRYVSRTPRKRWFHLRISTSLISDTWHSISYSTIVMRHLLMNSMTNCWISSSLDPRFIGMMSNQTVGNCGTIPKDLNASSSTHSSMKLDLLRILSRISFAFPTRSRHLIDFMS
ncbi:hypothetical protein BS47DRAFT_780825 [Hydnum rufescens UP504]|uniref:F-box domain-containing protein n=1 Tax=Hydnum rufescens UP504 TaxID=1448309 RepID=A0A9P6DY26_9AGAM|nr:hypothetical protein BS47DRAFT_780825 [Hydnum rufescens UP504]